MNDTSSYTSRVIRFALLVVLCLARQRVRHRPSQRPVFNGAIDFPSVYFFRGIRQEADPKFTTFVAGDVGIPLLADGSGALKTAGINVGTWNAFMTGSSGSDRPGRQRVLRVGPVCRCDARIRRASASRRCSPPTRARTTCSRRSRKSASRWRTPARWRRTRSSRSRLAAMTAGRRMAGSRAKGTYLELGIGPSWPMADGKATVAVPVKLGFSLKDYYELNGEDQKFGYVVGGVLFTVPFARREVESPRRRQLLRTRRDNEGVRTTWRREGAGDRVGRHRVHVLTHSADARI